MNKQCIPKTKKIFFVYFVCVKNTKYQFFQRIFYNISAYSFNILFIYIKVFVLWVFFQYNIPLLKVLKSQILEKILHTKTAVWNLIHIFRRQFEVIPLLAALSFLGHQRNYQNLSLLSVSCFRKFALNEDASLVVFSLDLCKK